MFIYITIFIFLAVLAVEYEYKPFESNFMLGLIILSLCMLAGLRGPDVDKDYNAYQYGFDMVQHIDDPLVFIIYEPGFIAIVNFFYLFFKQNYSVAILLFFAFASVLLKVISVKRFAINPYLVILLYYSHYFFLHEMTQIRIGLASAIFLVSIPYYLQGRRLAFTGMILLASIFHYSAIFYLVVLAFDTRHISRFIYVGLLVLSVVLAFVRLPLLGLFNAINIGSVSSKIEVYAEMEQKGIIEAVNVFNVLNLCNMFCCIYLIFAPPQSILSSDKRFIFFLKCDILSIFLLSLLSGVPSVTFRFSQLFGITIMFLFAYLVKFLPFSKFNIFVVILIAGIYFYFATSKRGFISPYKIVNIR